MGFKDYIMESKYITVYHGDNFGTKKMEPKLMNNGNNQEGIGIYFGDLEIAKTYGRYIVKAEINPKKFVDSRGYVDEELSIDKVFKLLKELHKIDNEPLYYALTDWGIEISEPEDITDDLLYELAENYRAEEVRNFQIDLTQRFDVETFVKVWNKVFKDVHGTYNKQLNFYAIINNKQKVEKVQ